MQQHRLEDLSQALARAVALVDGARDPAPESGDAERPSFLVAQPGNDPRPVIEKLASATQLTFVVGAGASMEAGLPSWGELVRALLDSVAPSSLGAADRVAWLDTVEEAGLLGMAATARALAGSDAKFVAAIEHHLYRGRGADHFSPGPLAREIAAWKSEYPEIEVATFNYDQLLERAFEDRGLAVETREDAEAEKDGLAAVRHLHGVLTGNPKEDAVVLTEGDYATWREGSWQDQFMRRALEGVCVFLGLSFTDQNLLRWIYGSGGKSHVAVLARQSAPRLSRPVRAQLESSTRARLSRANVETYWSDFYAELAQLMHEARRRRGRGRPPSEYSVRAAKRASKAFRRCLPQRGLEARQRRVRGILAECLAGVRDALATVGVEPGDAALGLGLWGIDYELREVFLLGSSDRIHVDRSTVQGVPLSWGSEWVAVEAITQGSVVEKDPDTYASRWRSVRGIPLVWAGPDGRERIMVGAATLTTTQPAGDSVFDVAEKRSSGAKQAIDEGLQARLASLWN